MLALIWWLLVLGSGYASFRAWGGGAALGTVVGTYLLWWALPFGGLISTAAACYIGYRAETAEQKLLTG
jgi:hypothetical protein